METGTGKEAVAVTVQDQSGQKREEEPGGRIPRSGFETEADPRNNLLGSLTHYKVWKLTPSKRKVNYYRLKAVALVAGCKPAKVLLLS